MREDYSHLIGHRFPGGKVTVPEWMNRLWGDACLAEDTTPLVHPVLTYFAAIEGSGVSFQDIFDLMEAAADSGIMFGEQRLDFAGPLEVGREYEVEGEIVGVERKVGRRAGAFDLLTFALRLREPGAAEPRVVSTSTFVFPRKETP